VSPSERLQQIRRDRIQAAAYQREQELFRTLIAGRLGRFFIPLRPLATLPGKDQQK
jgi:hypothetical protein